MKKNVIKDKRKKSEVKLSKCTMKKNTYFQLDEKDKNKVKILINHTKIKR